MMTKHLLILLLPLLLALTGCETTKRSLNYECAGLRAAGDLTATAALDQGAVDGEVLDLIADGLEQLASDRDVTVGEAVKRIEAIPAAYRQYVADLLNWAATRARDEYASDLGNDARRRIRAYAWGLRQGAREYVPPPRIE